MYAGVCPCLPESRTEPGGESAPARMRKRRAESASPFCSVPEKRRCRAVSGSGDTPLAPPSPELRNTALPEPVLPCRKRPGRPEPQDSPPDPKRATAARCSEPAAEDSSGRFGMESRAEPREQRPGEEATRPGKTTVMQSNGNGVGEDQFCAFNTFQFWRTPLPEVDLSLLDPPTSGDAATRDSTEAMET